VIEDLLKVRFPAPKWAHFLELRAGTGYGSDREGRIDFAAFSMWDSTGDRAIACEVKRTRADFMRELRNPSKRAWVEKQFGECYFVVAAGIVQPDEVPQGWGLLSVTKNGDKLRQLKAPTQRKVDISQTLTRSILRRAAKLEEESESSAIEGHGPGLCCPMQLVQEAQDRSYEHQRSEMKAWHSAHDAYAPLKTLASLAHEFGLDEWTPSIVHDLVEKAASQRLRGLSMSIRRAYSELGTLAIAMGYDENEP